MNNFWKLFVAGLCCIFSFVIQADSEFEKTFGVRAEGSSKAACLFLARTDENGSQHRTHYLARPMGQTLSFAVINGLTDNAASIDATLTTASQALQQDNTDADEGCCVEIRRTGAVNNFAQPAGMVGGVIQDEDDLDAVEDIAGDVKIVAAINFCGQNGSYAGCQTGNSLILTTGFGASTIAHELGHMQGLCHVGTNCTPTCGQAGNCSGCSDPSSNNVMYFSVCAGNQDVISASECSTFRKGASQ